MCLRFCFVLGKGLQVTTLTSGIWPLFDETWLYFAEKSPARRLIFSKFRTGARQTSVRRLVGALLTSRFPCPIVKQEKAACHFRPHAALTPARNAVRRRFTDVSFWGFCGDFRKKCHQSSVFQRLCDGVPSDKVFHKTAVQRWKEKMTGAPSLSCGP